MSRTSPDNMQKGLGLVNKIVELIKIEFSKVSLINNFIDKKKYPRMMYQQGSKKYLLDQK